MGCGWMHQFWKHPLDGITSRQLSTFADKRLPISQHSWRVIHVAVAAMQDLLIDGADMPASHLPPLLGALRALTHRKCGLDLAPPPANLMVDALAAGGLLPSGGMHRLQAGAPGNPALSLTVKMPDNDSVLEGQCDLFVCRW
jgi:hypothetical protein